MPEKINEKILKDEIEPLEKKPSADFEFSKTSETEKLLNNVDAINDAINHDGVVRIGDLENMEKNLGEIMVDFSGEQFTIEELKNFPDIKENVKIWKEIVGGNYSNAHKFTHITPKIAEHLSGRQGLLYLSNLTSISDAVAEQLSKHQGNLELFGLATISDTSAKHLSKHQGYLSLFGLTTISDTSAEHLSKHQESLDLSGLTSISEVGAKHLSKHKKLYVNDKIKVIIKKYKQ